jgi:hypothetical protein
MTPIVDRATSRRRFIQFLAASPLFAGRSLSALAAEPFRSGRPIRSCGRRATTTI